MKRKLAWLAVVFVVSLAAGIYTGAAHADDPGTRQVLQGDLVYRATAAASAEARAVFLAQARAAWMLSVECGAPPQGTRVYGQTAARGLDGNYAATVELGVPIADCESLQRLPASVRALRAQPELARMVGSYEALLRGAAPAVAQAPVAARGPEPLPLVLWTPGQEVSHLRAIDGRVALRERERQRLLASGGARE